MIAAFVGLVVGAIVAFSGSLLVALLLGWDAAAATYLVWSWLRVGGYNATQTAHHAVRDDPTLGLTDIILIVASIASIVAAGLVVTGASSQSTLPITVALVSLAVSWLLVHTVFMLRYARLYYGDKPGGIDFNQSDNPKYTDFAYMAFTIGMTYQVSDTELQTSAIRSTALRQALISYLFGAVILAGVINLVAGLGK